LENISNVIDDMNLISKEEFYIRYYEWGKIINKNKKVLEIQNYKKLVGFNLQSGGFHIHINDVTDREDHYHFMMELRESGEVKDYIALKLLKETHKDSIDGRWYRLEPVHNPNGRHDPLQILYSELEIIFIFGELVCIYARRVWEI
jgi:hypothetical protein